MTGSSLKLKLNTQIDRTKWDDCIERYANGHIYAKSYYLDVVSPGWKALVYGDYEGVFPLTWRRKLFITYLFQPFFCQQLGYFGPENHYQNFLKYITRHFRHVDVQLNHGNTNYSELPVRSNIVLDLSLPYKDLFRKYNTQTKRKLKPSKTGALELKTTVDYANVVRFFQKNKGREIRELNAIDYERWINLIGRLNAKEHALEALEVLKEDKIVAASLFVVTHKRIILMILDANEEGRLTPATRLMIDYIIQKYSEKPLILDFEGSQIEGLKAFYLSFGGSDEPYPVLKKSIFL